MEDRQQKVDKLTGSANALNGEIQKYQGRLEAEKETLTQLEAQCHAKKIDPNTIDEFIDKLGKVVDGVIENVESKVKSVDESLSKFREV